MAYTSPLFGQRLTAEQFRRYAAGKVGGLPGIEVAVCAKPSLFVKRTEVPTASVGASGTYTRSAYATTAGWLSRAVAPTVVPNDRNAPCRQAGPVDRRREQNRRPRKRNRQRRRRQPRCAASVGVCALTSLRRRHHLRAGRQPMRRHFRPGMIAEASPEHCSGQSLVRFHGCSDGRATPISASRVTREARRSPFQSFVPDGCSGRTM